MDIFSHPPGNREPISQAGTATLISAYRQEKGHAQSTKIMWNSELNYLQQAAGLLIPEFRIQNLFPAKSLSNANYER
jgi:hypothetical protein